MALSSVCAASCSAMPESFMPATNAGQSVISARGAAVDVAPAGAGAGSERGAEFASAPGGDDSDFGADAAPADGSTCVLLDSESAGPCLTVLPGAAVLGGAVPLLSCDIAGSNARSRNNVIAKPVGSS